MSAIRRCIPLGFLVFPVVLFVLAAFPCFKDGDYVYVADGISASSTNMYGCYGYLGGFPVVAFYVSLVLMTITTLYGASLAFFLKLREIKWTRWILFAGFGLSAIFMTLASVLLVVGVEQVSASYLQSQGREVEKTSGFIHADLTFYLEMALPAMFWIWWGWSMAIDARASKKKD